MAEFRSLARTVVHNLLFMLGNDNASKSAARLLDIARLLDPVAELAALEDAGRVLDRLRGGLAAVGAVIVVYSWSGRLDDGPLYQRWRDHLADAFSHADEALRSIDDANDFFAELLDGACHLEVTGAANEVRLLRRALVRLFYDAWKICR